MELTKEYLNEIFKYDNGILYWNIRASQAVKMGSIAGTVYFSRGEYRRQIKINGKLYHSGRLVFLMHYGYLPKTVDHINRNPLDDRIENLREATISQNGKNKTSHKNSSSKYLGVSIKGNRWQARIHPDGKRIYLGSFKSEIEAALAYNKAAVLYHKEFASINIIQP